MSWKLACDRVFASRGRRESFILTRATLMPSAEVPLITPATIIGFFVMIAEARDYSSEVYDRRISGLRLPRAPGLPAGSVRRIARGCAKACRRLRRKELLAWCAVLSPICF